MSMTDHWDSKTDKSTKTIKNRLFPAWTVRVTDVYGRQLELWNSSWKQPEHTDTVSVMKTNQWDTLRMTSYYTWSGMALRGPAAACCHAVTLLCVCLADRILVSLSCLVLPWMARSPVLDAMRCSALVSPFYYFSHCYCRGALLIMKSSALGAHSAEIVFKVSDWFPHAQIDTPAPRLCCALLETVFMWGFFWEYVFLAGGKWCVLVYGTPWHNPNQELGRSDTILQQVKSWNVNGDGVWGIFCIVLNYL